MNEFIWLSLTVERVDYCETTHFKYFNIDRAQLTHCETGFDVTERSFSTEERMLHD